MVVDGAHGLGALDDTVADLGCDYFCAGTHKWMFAPRGTGLVWAKAENWARLTPTVPTFASLEAWNAWMNGDERPRPVTAFDVTPGGFQAYEHQWGVSAAFRFHEGIGRARVAGRIRELNDRMKAGLAAIPRVRVITPSDSGLSAGIVCFEIEGMDAETAGKTLLERRIIASASPYLPSYARVAPSLVNSPAEVDEVLRVVKEIAAA
jgi:selenocysteine lyase/cysteine desulfurase